MGYSLAVYSVDLDRLRSQIAAKDRTLFETLLRKHAEDVKAYDEEIEEYWDEEEEAESSGLLGSIKGLFGRKKTETPASTDALPEAPPTGAECLEALLMAGPMYGSIGHVYGYMFEWVCAEVGERLRSDPFESMRSGSGWLEGLDGALERNGIDLTLFSLSRNLTLRGAPVSIPGYDDFPSIGYIEGSEVGKALPLLIAMDRVAFARATPYPEEGGEALGGLIRMTDEAHKNGRGLVGFYY